MNLKNENNEESQSIAVPGSFASVQDWLKFLAESLQEVNQSNKILKAKINHLENKKTKPEVTEAFNEGEQREPFNNYNI